MKRFITHNGIFHADEVCGYAILKILYPEITFLRVPHSWDTGQADVKRGDIVADIGKVHAPQRGLYDHHQDGNLPATNALLWEVYGVQVCQKHLACTEQVAVKVAQRVKSALIIPVSNWDTNRNGYIDKCNGMFTISSAIAGFNGDDPLDSGQDRRFEVAAEFMGAVLRNEIVKQHTNVLAELVWEGRKLLASGVYLCEQYCSIWRERLYQSGGKAIIMPNPNGWAIMSANTDEYPVPSELVVREILPSEFVFRHAGGWLLVMKTKEAALEVAEFWYVGN